MILPVRPDSLAVGAFMTVFGLLNWGKVVSLVSNAVMTGFVMGIAILMMPGDLGAVSLLLVDPPVPHAPELHLGRSR